MLIEVKSHEWTSGGDKRRADFCVFVDGEPRTDIGCESCRFMGPEECAHPDPSPDLQYPFCGHVCGHYEVGFHSRPATPESSR